MRDNFNNSEKEFNEFIKELILISGIDFTQYCKASLKRRLTNFMQKMELNSFPEILLKIKDEPDFLADFVDGTMISTSEFFRDPLFYKSLREKIIPQLKTYAHIKIWHAGCSVGKEVYSLAILLKEENLLDRCIIYATDLNSFSLHKAEKGIFPVSEIKKDSPNYFDSGGKHSFHQYWHIDHGYGLIDKSIMSNLVFSTHNLVTDSSFGEMNLIFCRNVLIYFEPNLQSDVLNLLNSSLIRLGFLCIGNKEAIMDTSIKNDFLIIDRENRIFQKKSRL